MSQLQLAQKVKETGLTLCLTHTYTGYPMVKRARQMIQQGMFGKIRKVYVSYYQGWFSKLSEREGNTQAAWRTDPKAREKPVPWVISVLMPLTLPSTSPGCR